MPQLKIAVVGAGSFVFGPSVVQESILRHRLDDLELVLIDPNRQVIEPLAALGQRLAHQQGLRSTIRAETDLARGLDGADFVLCSAAREMQRRFMVDLRIARQHDPAALGSEFGGVTGISNSLRQITLIQEICQQICRHCPAAWLLNLANPLPRVAQAAHESGVKTIGFCSVTLNGWGVVWRMLHGGPPLRYPFEPARSRLRLTLAGTNHFAWAVRIEDVDSGEDLYPRLRNALEQGALADRPLTREMLASTGYLPAAGDSHIRDFLPPGPHSGGDHDVWHGTEAERQRWLAVLNKAADGSGPAEPVFQVESWEKPINVALALAGGPACEVHALNLPNEGQVPQLPRGVYVETPARVTRLGVSPQRVDLPQAIAPLCARAAQVSDTLVRAARQRSRALVDEAVELDPLITDKPAGHAAISACLDAHADILGRYA